MGIIYNTITDNLNKRMFKVQVEGTYEPIVHRYFRDGDKIPINDTTGEVCISYLPIKDLIDMCFKNIEFTIVNPANVKTIVDLLDAYMDQMRPYRERDAELKVFLDRCEIAYNKFSHVNHRKIRQEEHADGKAGTKNILQILERMY